MTTGGVITTGGLDGSTIGGFVGATKGVGSTTGVVGSVGSTGSRLQPWMESMATRLVTLTASTHDTPTFMRERRLFCSSSSEPWGTNGFVFFMGMAPVASFL